MNQAFGGAFLIKLMLIFLSVYVVFMSLALNYTRAFRTKNQIINMIEQYEGYDKAQTAKVIDPYLEAVGYNKSINIDKYKNIYGNYCNNGYCVQSINSEKGPYYKVITFIYLQWPFLDIDITIPITGETRIITNLIDYK